MTTFNDEIRDLFLRLFKPRLAFLIAALILFIALEGGEVVAAFGWPFEKAIIFLSGKLFILLTLCFASNAIFYLSQLPKLRETLNKAEQMLNVQAFYPINYPDLPEEIKYSVRKYVTKSIKQINEHGTPLIVCSGKEHFEYYKNFAFNADKIYGTATRSPFYYASEDNIKSYINFFKQRNVTRVTILDKNTIEHIIARNIYNIDDNGTSKTEIPEIEWYEKQFNANHTHLWFLQELKSDCLLTDIHDEQRFTNYAIYLLKRSNKILLNYFERTNNMGFFLLKCMPPGTPLASSDNITSKINSFIEKLDTLTTEQDNGFYNNFQQLVKENMSFEEFKNNKIKFEYPIGTSVSVNMSDLLKSKKINEPNNWDELFKKLSNCSYGFEFINKFPSVHRC